jgi:hypothetical protein
MEMQQPVYNSPQEIGRKILIMRKVTQLLKRLKRDRPTISRNTIHSAFQNPRTVLHEYIIEEAEKMLQEQQ